MECALGADIAQLPRSNGHTHCVRWLDDYIDQMRERLPLFGAVSPPFTRIGSIFNAVMSSAGVAVFVYLALTDSPFFLVFSLGAAALATTFIRIAVRAQRGDFERR